MKLLRTLKIGREKVNIYHDNFQYFQPNIHTCGDCHIRAVCAATGEEWLEAFDGLYRVARKSQYPLGSTESITDYLGEKGFTWVAIKPKRGQSRPTVAEFAKSHTKGHYVLRVSNHVVGAHHGHYHDTWDCGHKSLYGYWEKKD